MCIVTFFGVPEGFETFPVTKDSSYYELYYCKSNYDWSFYVRQNKENIIHYIYVKYNLISGIKRGGALFGISLGIKDHYFYCINELINFFHSVYHCFVEDEKVLIHNEGITYYAVKSFEQKKEYLNDWIDTFKLLPEKLKNDIKPFIKNYSNTLQLIEQFQVNTENDVITKSFLKYGGADVLPEENKVQINFIRKTLHDEKSGFSKPIEKILNASNISTIQHKKTIRRNRSIIFFFISGAIAYIFTFGSFHQHSQEKTLEIVPKFKDSKHVIQLEPQKKVIKNQSFNRKNQERQYQKTDISKKAKFIKKSFRYIKTKPYNKAMIESLKKEAEKYNCSYELQSWFKKQMQDKANFDYFLAFKESGNNYTFNTPYYTIATMVISGESNNEILKNPVIKKFKITGKIINILRNENKNDDKDWKN